MLKKREPIISALKGTSSQLVKKNIKFGFRVPQKVNEAMRLNEKNGNNLWRYGIAKEIDTVIIEFKLLNEGENNPPTYKKIRCHANVVGATVA